MRLKKYILFLQVLCIYLNKVKHLKQVYWFIKLQIRH
jgi:hypothetical protein